MYQNWSPQVVYVCFSKPMALHNLSFLSCPKPLFLLIISYMSYFFRLVPKKPQTNTNLVKPNASQPNVRKQNFQRKSFTTRVSHACYSGHVSKVSCVKNSKAKFVANETFQMLLIVASMEKNVFLLLPCFSPN